MPKLGKALRPLDLPDLPRDRIVSVDVETTGLYPDAGARISCLSVAWWRDGVVGGKIDSLELAFDQAAPDTPWAHVYAERREKNPEFGETYDGNLGRDEWEQTCEWLADRRNLTAHNDKFEINLFRAGVRDWGGVDLKPNMVWDTMLGCRELWPTESASLKATASRFDWGQATVDYEKPLKRWVAANKRHFVKAGYPADGSGYDLVPWSIMEGYNREDTHLQLWLLREQLEYYEYGHADAWWFEREMGFRELLVNVEARGLPYPVARSREVAREARKRQEKIAAWDIPFQPLTDHGAKKYFYGTLNLPVRAVTEGGSPSLPAAVLRDLAQEGVQGAQAWWNWKKLNTAASMWWEGYADATGPDGRLRPNFRQLGTRTGRLSNERVNLQAVPGNHRLDFEILEGLPTPRSLVAEAVAEIEGWTFLETDLASAELRVASLFAGCEQMLDMVREGKNLHAETAKALFDAQQGDPDWKDKYQLGKRCNFSLLFDVGWKTFAESIWKETGQVLSERESKAIVSGWKRLYPEHPRAVKREMRRAERCGYVELANGKLKWFSKWDDLHKAHNNRVQASLGEFAKDWWIGIEEILDNIGVYDACEQTGVVGGLLLMVHDSADVLIPDVLVDDYRREVVLWTRELWEEFFPGVPGDCEIEEWK